MWILWFKKHTIIRILNLTKTGILHGKLLTLGIIVPFVLISIVYTVQQLEYLGGLRTFIDFRQQICLTYEIDANIVSAKRQCDWFVDIVGNSSIARISLNVFNRFYILAISNISGYFYMTHFTFLTLGLAMRDMAKEFSQEMVQSIDDVKKGIQIYLDIKQKVEDLNDIFGTRLLTFFVGSTSYFITGPDVFNSFRSTSIADKYSYLMYFSTGLLFWMTCAHFHASVQKSLKSWLDYQIFHSTNWKFNAQSFNNLAAIHNRMRLDSMEKECTAGCPSLAISTNYFAITNRFLGTVRIIIYIY